ncbi:MAG: phospholipase D family protein [Dokdonella sp.]
MFSKKLRSLLAYLFLAIALASGCAKLPPRPDTVVQTALPAGQTTLLDRTIQPALNSHPGQSGFRLLSENADAFAMRIVAARRAERSLDAMYYLWHNDLTGRLMAREALRAADRGVRVRLLMDDNDARAKDAGFAALAAHPLIEVRLFNPFATRSGALFQFVEGLSRFKRLNRRMHNKVWIADNRIAVAGGRNLGDEYFGANTTLDFLDLDVAMVGPVVQAHSAMFDRYWNSTATWPIAALGAGRVTAEALAELRKNLDAAWLDDRASTYLESIREENSVQRLMEGDWTLSWTATWKLLTDNPNKIFKEEGSSNVLAGLVQAFNDAKKSIVIVSPYFVPGNGGTKALTARVKNGKQVVVLTNSLAATDVALVHGGYASHRRKLLRGGVELYELKAIGPPIKLSLIGSSQASLHTKAALVDKRVAFVGSYNLDPRSTSLNTEMGVLIEQPEIAAQLHRLISIQTDADHAWRVSIDGNGSLQWSDGDNISHTDPDASLMRKVQAWLAQMLPIESQL